MTTAPPHILAVWHRFDAFPMETLTKAWVIQHSRSPKQRTVDEMIAHRHRFGASGNCYDLALWLAAELKGAGIQSHFISDGLGPGAHVAVVALDAKGRRYLCDLGDLWIKPVCLDEKINRADGLFAGAWVSIHVANEFAQVEYLRPGGKMSAQAYDLTPHSTADFLELAHYSQNNVSAPLVEMRLMENKEIVHWEFSEGQSFLSTMSGLQYESPLQQNTEWAKRIEAMTGMNAGYATQCLDAIRTLLPGTPGEN